MKSFKLKSERDTDLSDRQKSLQLWISPVWSNCWSTCLPKQMAPHTVMALLLRIQDHRPTICLYMGWEIL